MQAFERAETNRIVSIDVFKGINILFVVLGHSWAPFVIYIYLFHMPAFIVASGVTYNGTKDTFLKYLLKKVKTLLLPYYICNLLFILLYQIVALCGQLEKLTEYESYNMVINVKQLIIYGNVSGVGGASWFLIVLFEASILFKVCEIFGKKTKYIATYYISFLLMLVGWWAIKNNMLRWYNIDLGLFATGFFAVGNWLHHHEILKKEMDNKWMVVVAIIGTIFFGKFYFNNLPMNWPSRLFDNSFFIQMISCLLPMYLCWLVACAMENLEWFRKILECVGRRTFTVLMYHFLVFKVEFILLYFMNIFEEEYIKELTPKYYPSGIWWLLLPIVNVLLCVLLSKVAEKNKISNLMLNGKMV